MDCFRYFCSLKTIIDICYEFLACYKIINKEINWVCAETDNLSVEIIKEEHARRVEFILSKALNASVLVINPDKLFTC